MKKVLFATTALIATAGMAAADVTFGGYGRFGLLYVENAPNETSITSRFRLQIDATAESDAGVEFGARVRIQQDNDDYASTTNPTGTPATAGTASSPSGNFNREGTGINGVRFFARSGGFELGVGNIFGALEFMPGQYPIDLGLTGHSYDYVAYNFRGDAYDSDDGGAAGYNGIEVTYSAGDFSVHASASDVNDRVALVGAYTFSGFTFALGLQDSSAAGDTEVTATVSGDIGPANVTLAWADNGSGAGNGDHWVLAGTFDIGAATSIDAYYADADYFAEESIGLGFHHSLGGGVSLRGGISNNSAGTTLVDLGARFNF